MSDAPIVFMSHASEDKERFVLEFARRLRERGIDIWLDRWEMYPGDSLVDKIFNEGIKKAAAIIVVLSQYSVQKPWVKEELDVAVVRRINSGCKLIPIVLDNCEVPEVLKATLWEKIADLDDYRSSLDRVVAAIFGHRDKPEIGPQPAYARIEVMSIPGFSKADVLVLSEFARRVLQTGDLLIIYTAEVWDAVSKLGIPRGDFNDSCAVLCDRFALRPAKVIAPEPPYYSLTEHGLDLYLRGREPEFWAEFEQAAYAILNEDIRDNNALGTRLGVDRLRARLILMMMERRQFIRLRHAIGGHAIVTEIRPALRRSLQGGGVG